MALFGGTGFRNTLEIRTVVSERLTGGSVTKGHSKPRLKPGRPEGSTASKIVKLLEVLGLEANSRGMSLSEISERNGLTRPSAHRLLSELVSFGFVEQDPNTDRYRLGLRTVQVAWSFMSRLDVRRQAAPYLTELVERTKETAHLMVLTQGECVCIDQIESPAPLRIHSEVGKRMPVHSTASGKALVAHVPEEEVRRLLNDTGMEAKTKRTITNVDEFLHNLRQVRKSGYALDDMENESGARCIAAPLFDHEGRTLAAICISGPASRITLDRSEELGSMVREIASRASRRLGFDPSLTVVPGLGHRGTQGGPDEK
jgi:IclR family transcriptional regulator, KDG regulon repressor